MAALADVDDVEALLGDTVDQSRVAAMLAQASARFRTEARCEFTQATNTKILRVLGGEVDLPDRPVVTVDSVASLADDGSESTQITGWVFDGIHTVHVGDQTCVINASRVGAPETVSVQWDSGYSAIPEDVRWAVAAMVVRAIGTPAPEGVTSEQVGAYSYRAGGYTASGALSMSRDEVTVARKYRPRSATMRTAWT